MRRSIFFVLLATACASGGPEAPRSTAIPYNTIAPVVDRSTLTPVEDLGYEIYLRDIAASRATDSARTEVDLEKSGATGWIVVPYERGYLVRFIDRDEHVVIDVSVNPTSTLSALVMKDTPAKELSEPEKSMWRARQLASIQSFARCSDRYNTVVIPESDAPDSDWLVYLLAASSDPSVVMMGGHQKFRVDRDGGQILEHIPLSKSCINSRLSQGTSILFMTHIVSAEPVESQVYLNYLHGYRIAVRVVETQKDWMIEGGRIREMTTP